MTEEIFRADAYVRSCEAVVAGVVEIGVLLDRTVFYPTGGGQPGDTGTLRTADGRAVTIVDTVKGAGGIVHVADDASPALAVGNVVTAEIDWQRRHRHMRMHTALHLLCAIIDGGVTGGSIGEAKSRLDFDLPDTSLDKEHITAELNRLVAEDHPVGAKWISDAELAANPDMVRTMSVKPPSGAGEVRILDIPGIDLQPCGGTHVASTGEIGVLRVGKIENKGKHNRRVNVHLED
jgi:misacylated tRNA(Ala) deacylase